VDGNGDAIDLGFQNIFDGFRAQMTTNSLVEAAQLIEGIAVLLPLTRHVVGLFFFRRMAGGADFLQRKHRFLMFDPFKGSKRLAANALGGRIRRDQFRATLLQFLEFR